MSITPPARICVLAGLALAALHPEAMASYGQMNLKFPPWFYFGAAAVLALPGALAVLGLQALLGGKKLPGACGWVVAAVIGGLSYNASIDHAALASWRRLLQVAYLFLLPVLGTLWVLCLQARPRPERVVAWVLCVAGLIGSYWKMAQGTSSRTDFLQYEAALLGGLAVSMAAWHWGQAIALRRRPEGYARRPAWGGFLGVVGLVMARIERPLALVTGAVVRIGRWTRVDRVAALGLVLLAAGIALVPLNTRYQVGALSKGFGGSLLHRLIRAAGEDTVRAMGVGLVLWLASLPWSSGPPAQAPRPPLRATRLAAGLLFAGLAHAALLFTGWGRFERGSGPVDYLLLNALVVMGAFMAFDVHRHARGAAVRAVCVLMGLPLAAYVVLSVLRMLLRA